MKKEIQDKLKRERMTMTTNKGLYNTVVKGDLKYSLTLEQYQEKMNHLNNLQNDIDHQIYKENSENCLKCEKVFTCRYLTRCELTKQD